MKQEIIIWCQVPSIANLATRTARFAQAREKAEQQDAVRGGLDMMAVRPKKWPCKVTLVRLSKGKLDSDNVVGALKYIRDTVARWAHGLPEKQIAVKPGSIKWTRPRAPDGDGDGIEWAYGQEKGRQGVRIVIEEMEA